MKLTYDELLSNCVFNCNLRHYTEERLKMPLNQPVPPAPQPVAVAPPPPPLQFVKKS